jgi:hypothetical protein
MACSQQYSTACTRSPQPAPMILARSSSVVRGPTHAIARGQARGNQ